MSTTQNNKPVKNTKKKIVKPDNKETYTAEEVKEVLFWGARFGAIASAMLADDKSFSFKEKDEMKRFEDFFSVFASDCKKFSKQDMKNFLSMSAIEWGMYILGDSVEIKEENLDK
jgi:hypothetical protein